MPPRSNRFRSHRTGRQRRDHPALPRQDRATCNRPRPARPSSAARTLNARPASRVGEVLEAVPGLIVTQHSGEGKANQYFLRGFNLDHGTDLAISVDGMPVNMPTHGHGQGYADINFLIPELVQSVNVRKGPYFADKGDFASAGAVDINYLDKLPKNIAELTFGSFGYARALAAGSTAVGEGTLLAAFEANKYNGPWDVPDNVRKLNGVLRYSQGTATDGFTLTGMAYSNGWNSTDQVAQRAIDQGLIPPLRFARSDRRRHLEPVLAVGQFCAVERLRPDQGQRLCDPLVAAALQRLHLFPRRSRQRRPVQPDRPAHGGWPRCQPCLRLPLCRHRNPNARRPANPRRRHRCRPVQDGRARDAVDRARRQRQGRQCRPVGGLDVAMDRLAAHHSRHS